MRSSYCLGPRPPCAWGAYCGPFGIACCQCPGGGPMPYDAWPCGGLVSGVISGRSLQSDQTLFGPDFRMLILAKRTLDFGWRDMCGKRPPISTLTRSSTALRDEEIYLVLVEWKGNQGLQQVDVRLIMLFSRYSNIKHTIQQTVKKGLDKGQFNSWFPGNIPKKIPEERSELTIGSHSGHSNVDLIQKISRDMATRLVTSELTVVAICADILVAFELRWELWKLPSVEFL